MDDSTIHALSSTPEQLLSHSSFDQSKSRFEKHSPFVTLIIMSFGPLITSITSTLLDFLELFFLTKRFTEESPIQLQGFAGFCQLIVILIITYFSTAVSMRLSRLIGENRENDAMQFFTDVTKISILFLLIALPFVQFLVNPMLDFMNCPDSLKNQCYLLLTVSLGASPFILIFNISCSFLQAIGRSFLNGILHIVQSIFQVLILTPLFLFVFKIDITLIALQYSISQSLLGIILFIMIYTNKFGYKASFSSYPSPILVDTIKALKNSLPSALGFICNVVPPIFIMRFLLSTAKSQEDLESLAGIQTILGKVSVLSASVGMAINSGLITVGTYEYGSHNYNKLLKYLLYSVIVTVSFNSLFSIFMIVKPQLIASIYFDSATDLELSKRILKIPYFTNWFTPVSGICQIFLVCVGKPVLSAIPSIIQTFTLILISYIFSKIFHSNPERIYHAYNINDIVIFILSLALAIPSIYKLRKERTTTEDTSNLIDNHNEF